MFPEALPENEYKDPEFNASEVREVLQELFPTRKLVLSQFTFFNQIGVSKPTGDSFRRGRRCYKTQDLLPIAVVLALKEQGIPNKNISKVPGLVREHSEKIFSLGAGSKISGFRDNVCINFVGESVSDISLVALLDCEEFNHSEQNIYWSYDVGQMALDLVSAVRKLFLIKSGNGGSSNLADMKSNTINSSSQEETGIRLKAVA